MNMNDIIVKYTYFVVLDKLQKLISQTDGGSIGDKDDQLCKVAYSMKAHIDF